MKRYFFLNHIMRICLCNVIFASTYTPIPPSSSDTTSAAPSTESVINELLYGSNLININTLPLSGSYTLTGQIVFNPNANSTNVLCNLIVKNNSSFTTALSNTTVFTQPFTIPSNVILTLDATNIDNTLATYTIQSANPNLLGHILINNINLNFSNGSNLGTGNITVNSNTAKITLNSVTLNNTIAPQTGVTTLNFIANGAAILNGDITGNATTLNFGGAGITTLASSNVDIQTINVNSGTLLVNGTRSATTVDVASGGTFGGNGSVQDLNVASGGALSASGNLTVSNTYIAAAGAIQNVMMTKINSNYTVDGALTVHGDVTLNGQYIINLSFDPTLLIPANTFSNTPFVLIYSEGTMTADINNIKLGYPSYPGLTITDAVISTNPAGSPANELLFYITNTQDINGANPPSNISYAAPATSVNDSGVQDLVFQSTNIVDAGNTSTTDAFRGFRMRQTTSVTNVPLNNTQQMMSQTSKNLFDSAIVALGANGPIGFQKNETRIWISPYVNRTRMETTALQVGNQSWSGGTLVGFEKRDRKNIWTTGFLTGLMTARSYIIGQPDSNTITKSVLFGLYNTYKYNSQWGHELLYTRALSLASALRYATINRVTNVTDISTGVTTSTITKNNYIASSSYRTIDDKANAQINYLFNIIKDDVTCRLNYGLTYTTQRAGQSTEHGAPGNNLYTPPNWSTGYEAYTGVGLRKIFTAGKKTVRLTAVYEYGYAIAQHNSSVTITQLSAAPTNFLGTNLTPRANKHYVQLNASYLNHDTGMKFILSYAGILYKNVGNHTWMMKCEYRF